MSGIDVLLFDLGGVLVDFSGVRDIAPLLSAPATEAEIRERWNTCEHTYAYQLGKLTREEFGSRFVRDWNLNVTPENFLREFRGWSKSLFPGAKAILDSLRSRYRLVALSNSNELHWERNTNDLGITRLFDEAISSHQIGLCKPNSAFYTAALEELGVSPSSTMFFDDVHANVVAASALGICAYQVAGVEALRECLTSANLL